MREYWVPSTGIPLLLVFSSKATSNQHRGAFSQQQQVTTKVWSYRQDSRSQSKPRLWKRNTSREGKIGNPLGIVESPGQETERMMDSDLSQETVRGSGEISIAQLLEMDVYKTSPSPRTIFLFSLESSLSKDLVYLQTCSPTLRRQTKGFLHRNPQTQA
jgi:hypothetical protein